MRQSDFGGFSAGGAGTAAGGDRVAGRMKSEDESLLMEESAAVTPR